MLIFAVSSLRKIREGLLVSAYANDVVHKMSQIFRKKFKLEKNFLLTCAYRQTLLRTDDNQAKNKKLKMEMKLEFN